MKHHFEFSRIPAQYGFTLIELIITISIVAVLLSLALPTYAATKLVLSQDGYFDVGQGLILWNCHQVSGEEKHMPASCRDNHWSP